MALDGLGEKLKSLFKPKEDPRFKGQGRRLGEAHTSGARPSHPQPAPISGGRAANLPLPSTDGNAPSEAPSPLKPPPQPLGPGGRTALVLSRSHRTEDVVLDAAVMANTPTGKEAHLLAAHKPTGGTGARGPAKAGAGHGGSPASPPGSPGSPGSPPAHLEGPSPPCPASPPYPAAAAATRGAGGGSGGSVGDVGAGLTVEVPRASPGGGGGRGSPGEAGVAAGGAGGHAAAGLAGRGRGGQFRSAVSNVGSMVSTISTPTAAEKRMGGFRCPAPPTDGAMADYGVAPATSQAYELQRCLALVLSSTPLSNYQLSTSTTASSAFLEAAAVAAAAGPSSGSVAAASAADADAGSSAAAATDGGSLDPLASTSTSSKSLQETPTAAAVAEAGAGISGGGGGAGGGGAAVAVAVAGPRECCDALLRVLRNVLTRPAEPKFRQIRLSNPRVQETIVGVPGAVEFLEAAGFQMRFSPEDGGDGGDTAGQAHLVLPDEVPPSALAEAFRILSAVMAAHGIASPAPAQAGGPAASGPAGQAAPQQQQQQRAGQQSVAPAVERCTQVLLPAAPDVTVPEWFFERTGAEVREQWAAMVRRREEQERFMTRTMREVRRQQLEAAAAAGPGAAAGGGGGGGCGSADVATVRVRFPEGVCLQGQFGAGEPVSRVFEWVAAALRSPALTFELIKPDRRPLTTSASAPAAASTGRSAPAARGPDAAIATVRAADMLPSVLLNLRPTGQEAAALAAANVPLLSDALLRITKPQ